MSNFGQVALGIVGGIIGFYLGGPTGAAYGFQLGLAVGTVVSPTQLPGTYGPRLSENRTTTAQLGAAVVEIFGIDASAGTVIWLGPVAEHATTQDVGGKGAPEQSQTTYSYTQSIAVGICRGPMGGLLRIWENGKLVYDVRDRQPDEDDTTYYNRITFSQEYELGFQLYLGDEAQLPDPTIEAVEGVGQVPGYRGLMYIVYPDRTLKDDQARRHPSWKFEVFDTGSMHCEDVQQFSNEVLYPWTVTANGLEPPLTQDAQYEFTLSGQSVLPGDFVTPLDPDDLDSGPYANLVDALGQAELFRDCDMETYLGYDAGNPGLNIEKSGGYSIESSITLEVQGRDPESIDLHYNARYINNPLAFDGWYPEGNEGLAALNADVVGSVIWEHHQLRLASSVNQATYGGDFPGGALGSRALYPGFIDTGHVPSVTFWLYSVDVIVSAKRIPQAPPSACSGLPPAPGLPGYCIASSGQYVSDGPWTYDDSTTYRVLRRYQASSTAVVYPLGPARPIGHDEYDDQAFWEAYYAANVAAGYMEPGLVYGVDYPEEQGFAYVRDATLCSVSAEGVSIAQIVTTICDRVGLTAIDVTDLLDRFVRGYQVPRVMDARSAIAPLRSVGFFDAVESGGIVKFPVRGKAVVRTLEESDLGAVSFGSDPTALVTTRLKQDVELPRQLFIQYRDPARDYDQGQQASPTRLVTEAVNDVYVDVAAAIDATQAAQSAEVIWADMWASRWQHSISVDQSQTDLEPTDCILVPVDGRLERMRIVATEDSGVILRQFQLLRDDDGAYVSIATSDPPAIPPQVITIFDTTDLIILDIPALRLEDDDAGVYFAAARMGSGNAWGGASVMRSAVNADAFTSILSLTTEVVAGLLAEPLPTAACDVWDMGNAIVVTLARGQFSSRTEADVLNGANSLAIGMHGRWEIVQFVDAVQTGTFEWTLTKLLRGRRGTDHNIGTAEVGDRVVLISGGGIARYPMPISEVLVPFDYRAPTIGATLASATTMEFTGTGEALRPFSPVHVHASRAVDGALSIEFVRRDRMLISYEPGEPTPMSESVEDYEIDILDGANVVRRTISSSTAAVVYSADQQVTDFGAVQAAITVRIYQISVAVGRGHYREAVL